MLLPLGQTVVWIRILYRQYVSWFPQICGHCSDKSATTYQPAANVNTWV